MTYRLLKLFVIILSFLPLSVGRFLGRGVGLIFSMLPIKRRDTVEENIRNSFGESLGETEIKRLKRRINFHFGQMVFEVPHILRLNERNLKKYVDIVNEEHLENAIKKGKGVFLLTGHLGNWEFLCSIVSLRFGALSVIARPLDFKPLDRLVTELRTRFGSHIIPKKKAMRKILKTIKRKEMVGILLDQSVGLEQGVFVNFLGRLACTNKGLALMAQKTGSPVVPTFAVRQKDGKYLIRFEEEIKMKKTGDKIKDVEDNTALFTKAIEDYVVKYPDQWLWFHRRWKTLPYCRIDDREDI